MLDAGFERRFAATNRVVMNCQPYALAGSVYDSVAYRSALLVHEGWHAWEATHDCSSPHGTTQLYDPFFYHSKSLYQGGDLHTEKGGHQFSHSVFQVEAEYLCDLADSPGDAIAFAVRMEAQAGFMEIAPYNIRNPPPRNPSPGTPIFDGTFYLGINCGAPDLSMGPPDRPAIPDCETCSSDADCLGVCRSNQAGQFCCTVK